MGWLLPAPGGRVEFLPRIPVNFIIVVNISAIKNLLGVTVFADWPPPVFALTFWQNSVEKFPCPSPSPGAHHVWNLSSPPKVLPAKKFWGPPVPPRGRYEGSKFQLPPLPPQIPFVKGRSFSGYALESIPATISEILVNLRATQPEIFSLSNWPPAPGYV